MGRVLDGGSWWAVIRLQGVLLVMGGHNAEPNGFDEILELMFEKGVKKSSS